MEAISLREYTGMLRVAVATRPELRDRWVTAELSDVAVRGGHCYLELVEKNQAGQTMARIRGTIWQSVYCSLREKFIRVTGRELGGGIKLLVRGSASYHEVFGVSFNVTDIDPSYTLGDMERVRREILAALAREGVINRNRSLPVPVAPQRIAVVSASGAAGYGDFINQLAHNPYGIKFYTRLFAAVMQGERTSASVRAALEEVEMTIDLWDCVVIIRGGGSSSDLNGFDDLDLAREVALFPLPVIVGIGHERDRTVLDEIANVRVKTPTAAAEWLVSSCAGVLSRIMELCRNVVTGTSMRLNEAVKHTLMLQSQLQSVAGAGVRTASSRLASAESLLPQLVMRQMERSAARLNSMAALIPGVGRSRIAAARGTLDFLSGSVPGAVSAALDRAVRHLGNLEGIVGVLNPENTLKRGYTLTLRGASIVRNSESLSEGEEIVTRFADGEVRSTVMK